MPLAGCTDIITHRFFTGEAITGADSIRVKVNVTATGAWNYQTDTINGISFSGGGAVSETGLQYIAVAPKGTPALPGNFVHHFTSDTSQANVFVSVTDKNVTTEAVPADTPYFNLTIDSTIYTITNDNNDPSHQVGGWSPSADSGSVMCGIGPGIYPNPPGTGTLSIQKNYIGTTNPALTDNDFKTFFKPGAYRFAINTCDRMTDGFLVFWSDTNGQLWDTFHGNGQEGSYFKITGLTDGYNSDGRYYVKVKMRFSCKLYSQPSGQMKQLTTGEMVAYFVRYKE
ncbi:hypothetical protein QWZ08_11235 [Ferruginibacter paludis]|uniref:hypothetical protein n=1 Tax=Ferruginibacter paludis TaxID=1310417 RepID=UPI0025B4A3DB|nr:hypothetical protein [Ferruginibacter paludis]MDN3656204.1 hypothetical protein [Ferruginibacter paludis]